MHPDRWARVKDVFQSALECEAGRREAFLKEACAGDEALRLTVESMLRRGEEAPEFLESPALHVEALALAGDLDAPGSPTGTTPAVSAVMADGPALRRARADRVPWWIYLIAAAFLADFLLRTYCFDFGPAGFGFTERVVGTSHVVTAVRAGGLAEQAGFKRGDVVLARDGQSTDLLSHRSVTRQNLEVGRTYRFDIERNGQRLDIAITMRRVRFLGTRAHVVNVLWQVAALLLLATSFLIAFKRPRDAVALWGALTLATLSVGLYLTNHPPGYAVAWRSLPWIVGILLWIPNVCILLMGPIGLTFFASFPRGLIRSRWVWAAIWLPGLVLVPLTLHRAFLTIYQPTQALAGHSPGLIDQVEVGLFGAYGLAMLAAIVVNYFRLDEVNEKRRLRLLIAGGALGTVPALVRFVVLAVAPGSAVRDYLMSMGPTFVIVIAFLAFPVSFGYAVLRHRLLGIQVIVRLGVQYALARGLVISLVPLLGILLAVDALVHGDQPLTEIVRVRGWLYAGLAGVAIVVHVMRRRWADAIDRRFFHEQYDAVRLLRGVAEDARHAGSLEHTAPLVLARIEAALHPEFVALLFRRSGDTRFRPVASAPSGTVVPSIDTESRLVALLRGEERPLEVTDRGTGWLDGRLPDAELGELQNSGVELLVPMVMGPGRHEALLVLGHKRSQELYTREDQEALAAIASSLALLVEGPTPQPDRLTGAFEECPQCGTCYDSGTACCSAERASLVSVPMPRILAGRYRLERRLGRGGMGKVYEASDVALGRRVAVKVIRDEWVNSPGAARRFAREARAVAGFTHPNVVTVHDYGLEAGTRAFLVMELLEGATLRDDLRRCGRLDAARTTAVFRGVCAAADAAHRRQFVHRDLKPENIFLARTSAVDEATEKVLDFGVAKPLAGVDDAAESDGTIETAVGVLVGTAGYMSPEQLLGEPPDVSWDLWTLAVVAYESLTGALPFPVDRKGVWRQSVLAGRRTPVGAHLPDPPARWEAFFDRALAADRASRPASAARLLKELEQALA